METVINGVRFELRNLKIAEFASKETTCFKADFRVDGVLLCVVSNEGHGGNNDWRSDKLSQKELYQRLHAVAARVNPNATEQYEVLELGDYVDGLDFEKLCLESDKVSHFEVLDYCVETVMGRTIAARELKRMLRNRVVYVDKDGALMEMKARRGSAYSIASLTRYVRENESPREVLNDLPFYQALETYLAASRPV